MQLEEQFYTPAIAARAVEELTTALNESKDDAYAKALLADPRMSSNRGHLASCGINMRTVKQAKVVVELGLPTLESQQRARQFLDTLDMEEKAARHG